MKGKFNIIRVLFICALFVFQTELNAQSTACPSVNAGPDVTICGGCTNLLATIQGTLTTNTYSVTSVPYTPFSYNTGTPVLVGIDDEWSPVITLPFCFQFFGNTYTQCVLGSNDVVSFDISQAGGYNTWPISAPIPTNSVPDMMNCIMGPWHDIDPSVSGNMYWQVTGTAPCRRLIVSWDLIPMFSCNNLIATAQTVLYETTNIIDVYIQDKPLCASWNAGAAIEGIQDATGSTAFVVPGRNYPIQWTANNDAWRFAPNGAPNYTITWLDGNNNPVGNTAGITVCPTSTTTYTAQVVNQTCNGPITVTDQITVFVSSGNINITTSALPASCNSSNGSATATVTGNGPFTYSWAPGGQTTQTATGLAPGTYTVTVTDVGGCQATSTIVVPGSSGITAALQSQTNLTCANSNNGTATITVSGGSSPYTFLWSNSTTQQNATGLSSGTYTVTITDANGCTTTQTVTITGPPPIVANTSTTYASCGANDGTATVTASGGAGGPYTYAWSPSGGTGSTASGLAIGNYTVTVTDVNGCTQTNTASITNLNGPTATVSSDVTITVGNSTSLTGTGGGSYSWSPALGLSCTTCQNPMATPSVTTQYCLTVTDVNGCSDIACMTVYVDIPCPTNTDFSLPNAFSPNADGHNDIFTVQGLNVCIVTYTLVIYDRWGEKVFETEDPLKGWDGTFNGKPLAPAVFVYYLNATYVNGTEVVRRGNISLIK